MAVAFLVISLLGFLLTLNAYRPLLRVGPLSLFTFTAGWLASELPFHRFILQLFIGAFFVWQGALDSWPGWVAAGLMGLSWVGHVWLIVDANRARDITEEALRDALGADYRDHIDPRLSERFDEPMAKTHLVNPFRRRRGDVAITKNIQYGRHRRRGRLDVYRHKGEPEGSPVLIQVHGGAWVTGNKDHQGWPLMSHLASRGWVCVAINYRLSPRSTWPAHIEDVKRAIVWVKDNIGQYGGNPDFIVITGGSAGGHLSSLAALTPNDPAFQKGFEDRDTAVQACVPFYGVYDFTNRDGVGRADLRRLLERAVIKRSFKRHGDVFEAASPMRRVTPAAPPFFVIHGKNDVLVPVAEARLFAAGLRATSTSPVAYAELPGAQHAFEVFASVRTAHVINAVERFVASVYSRYLQSADRYRAAPESFHTR